MILYFFYKNKLFTIPQFFFVFTNAYSGLSLFNSWYSSLIRYMTFYNMIFTALPLAIKAIFEQDVHYLALKKDAKGELVINQNIQIRNMIPYIYKVGQLDTIFNNVNFLLWIAKGIVHGFLIWLTCLFSCVDSEIVDRRGFNMDFWFISVTMFSAVFVVATLQKVYMIRYWTWFNFWSLTVFSVACYVAWMFIADVLFSYIDASGIQDLVWSSPLFYLLLLLNAGLFTGYDFAERFLREWFGHNLTTKARLLVQTGAVEKMTKDDFSSAFETDRSVGNKIRQKDTPGRFN